VTITFWHCASDEAGTLMTKYIDEFNKTNKYRITVNAIYQGQYSDATTMLNTILSAKNYTELPDAMQIDATGKVMYSTSGKAYTVDDALAAHPDDKLLSGLLTAALANWQYGGKQLGLPFATSTTVTYYNNDLLKKAGWTSAPDNFSDVIDLYADMQKAGMTQKVLQAVPNTPTLANWLGQIGSYVVDQKNGSDGTATKLVCIDNGALAKFLTAWKAMYDAGALMNENSSVDSFVAGDVALMTSSSSALTSVLSKVGTNFEVGVSKYLRVNDTASHGASVSGSCVVMFDSGDELRKEAAWCFLQYLASAEVQSDFAAGTGYIPAASASVGLEPYKTTEANKPQYKVGREQLLKTPEAMRSVTIGPSKDFYYAIMQGCSDMLANNESVSDAVATLNDSLSTLLTEYARNNK